MDHAGGQDKGISITEGLKHAGATMEEQMDKAGATIASTVEKMRAAGDGEASVAADLTKDTRQAAAQDRAEAKKAQISQERKNTENHPPPFTKTPFV